MFAAFSHHADTANYANI